MPPPRPLSYPLQTMEHSVTKSVEWKNDQENHSEKTVTKMGTSRDGYKYNFGFASDAFTGGVSAKILDGTWKINGSATAERKPAKGEWKVTGSADVKSPDLGGAKAALNVSGAAGYAAILSRTDTCFSWPSSAPARRSPP